MTKHYSFSTFSLKFLRQHFFLIIFTFFSLWQLSCKLNDNGIQGSLKDGNSNNGGDIPKPSLLFNTLSSANSVGNIGSIFSFQLNYSGASIVNLQNADINIIYTSGASCSTVAVINSTTTSPTINVSGCSGDGTLQLVIAPGSSKNINGEFDVGTNSDTILVDNTPPTVSIGTPNPSSGSSSATFNFPITFLEADLISLTTSDVTLNSSGPTCDPPVIINGTTATHEVTLTNCIGNGNVGISIGAHSSEDLAGNMNLASVASSTVSVVNPLVCPLNFALVPFDGTYTTKDFCIMRFEAKNSGGSPVSSDVITPWVWVTRNDALTACRSLNSESTGSDIDNDLNNDGTYDLPSNNHWQTLAHDIEVQGANWTSGTVGTGCLFQGNNKNTTCGYDSVTDPDRGDESGRNIKARFVLSNTQTIWDLSGNVSEWMKESSSFNYGTSVYLNSLGPTTGNSGPLGYPKYAFGPLGDFTSHGAGTNYAGFGGFYSGTTGSLIRGGHWNSATDTGLFSAALDLSTSSSGNALGFRCIYKN